MSIGFRALHSDCVDSAAYGIKWQIHKFAWATIVHRDILLFKRKHRCAIGRIRTKSADVGLQALRPDIPFRFDLKRTDGHPFLKKEVYLGARILRAPVARTQIRLGKQLLADILLRKCTFEFPEYARPVQHHLWSKT